MLRRWIPVLLISIAAGTADAAWLPEERLTERPSVSDRTTRTNARAVAIDTAGNVHVAWYGGDDGIYQVWYSRRDVLTGTWSDDTVISTEPDGACFPCIAADVAGNIHVLWQVGAMTNGLGLHYRRRDAVTGHWDALDTVVTGVHVERPSIAVRDVGFVVAAWEEQVPGMYKNVFVSTRTAGGWQTPEPVSESVSVYDVRASIAIGADSTIGVLWERASPTRLMLFRVREDTLWGRVETLRAGSSGSSPSLWAQPNGVWHAVWQGWFSGGVGDYVIYCQRRNEAWQDTVVLPRVSRYPRQASVCADQQDSVHVVWMDEPVNYPELFHSAADSAGLVWSVPCTLTHATGRREYPTITSGPTGNLAVVWTDERNSQTGHPDVYCLRQGPARDIALTEITAPGPVVDSGETVTPTAVVENHGEQVESFPVWFRLPDGYQDETSVVALAPGAADTITFAPWSAGMTGWQAMTCSTSAVADTFPDDNVLHDSFFVVVRDVSADSIVSPQPVVRIGWVSPEARVNNRGNQAANVRVFMRICESNDTVYSESTSVDLEPGSDSSVVFPQWRAWVGSFTARCSVAVEGDLHPENDTTSLAFDVPPYDVYIMGSSPPRQVDSGYSYWPRIRIYNYSRWPLDLWARFGIGSDYMDSVFVQDLRPNFSRIVTFREWQALHRGWQQIACSLFVVPESIVSSVMHGSTFVIVRDVAVDSIVAPRGALAADTVVPQVRVCNPGNDTAQFAIRFRILREDSSVVYDESVGVELEPGSTCAVEFPVWCGTEGSYLALCSLGFAGDMVPGNDTASVRFTLHRGDVWITAITAPGLAVDSGDVVRPGVAVHNHGAQAVSFAAGFVIADGYADSLRVEVLPAGEDTILEFREWAARERGLQALRCSLRLAPAGTVVGPVLGSTFVRVVDAAADSILVPRGAIAPGAVRPRVRFSNPGNEDGRMTVRVRIVPVGPGFEDSLEVMLAPGRDTIVEFAVWDAQAGQYELTATVAFPGDMVPGNDTARASVVVESLVRSAWVRRADVPRASDGKRTGRGGALVAAGTLVHAFKGRRSHAWYAYAPGSDSWTELAPIPGDKPVRDGAALCYDGGDFVYALKGRVTREFWRYSVSRDSWETCRSLPDGTRPVRYGTGLAFVAGDTDRVFMVKGSGTLEFLEYLVGYDRWHARRPVPHGPEGRECRHGTALCVFQGRVFCLKGGSDEFYEYVPGQDAWFERANLPRASRSGLNRRSGKGAVLASDPSGGIYALKGRSTREFWHYDPGADAWVQLDDLPFGPDRHGVRRGSALACGGEGAFALKGGPYCELWCYDPEAVISYRPMRSGVLVSGERCHVPGVRFVSGRGVVVAVNPGRAASVRVYDAAGRRVGCCREVGQDCVVLSGFARPGVYFVAVGGERGSAKVVVPR